MKALFLAGGLIAALGLILAFGNGWSYEVAMTTGAGVVYLILGASSALAKRFPRKS